MRPLQKELIDAALAGQHALGVLPTGAGKSLTYQLTARFLPMPTLVISPLIALMQDQQEKLVDAGVPVAKLDSTLTAEERRAAESGVGAGAFELVYVTPERLENPEALSLIAAQGVSLVVIDEAHCVSQWGHDFRPAYLAIRHALKTLGSPPVLALTATAPPDLAVDIKKQLGIEDCLTVTADIDRPNLFFEVKRTPNDEAKRTQLLELLAHEEGLGIVYVATVKQCDELAAWLVEQGVRAGRYHGRMRVKERKDVQHRFMNDELDVIVATCAFGLGIDKPNVRFVCHFAFPDSLDSYYQEAGRAGRDGRPARAILLYRLEDRAVQAFFLGGKYPKRDDLARVYAALPESGASSATSIAERCGISRKRVAVILALLESMGIAAREQRRFARVRTFASDEELTRYYAEYEERHSHDRDRIDEMMHYAQTTSCRVRLLEEHFGEAHEGECGHCDNCRDRPSVALAAEAAAADATDGPASIVRNAVHDGDEVTHRTFGRGCVEKVEDTRATVRFGDGKTHVLDVSWLTVASAEVRED